MSFLSQAITILHLSKDCPPSGTVGSWLFLEFRVRKTFAADLPYGYDVANLRGFSRKIGENPRNLRQKGTWASQAKINSKLKLFQQCG
jgi:hypothetical protein